MPKNKSPRVHWYSNHPAMPTGYGTQSAQVLAPRCAGAAIDGDRSGQLGSHAAMWASGRALGSFRWATKRGRTT
jgi:hypothetical protein